MCLNGALPFLQLRGLDVRGPVCFAGERLRLQERAGEALQRERFGEGWWASFCARARTMAVPLLGPSERDFMPPGARWSRHPSWHRGRRCSARVHSFRLPRAASRLSPADDQSPALLPQEFWVSWPL